MLCRFIVSCPRVHLSEGQLNDHIKYQKFSPRRRPNPNPNLTLIQLELRTSEPSDNWADTVMSGSLYVSQRRTFMGVADARVLQVGRPSCHPIQQCQSTDRTGLVLPHSEGRRSKPATLLLAMPFCPVQFSRTRPSGNSVQSLISSVQRLRGLPRFLVPAIRP